MRVRRLSLLCLVVMLTACAPAAPSASPTSPPSQAAQATTAPAAKPAESKPAESKPAEAKPADAKPAAAPANTPITAATTAPASTAPAPKAGGDIIFGQDSEPDTLDPHVTGSRHTTIAIVNVFDTLVVQDDDLSFKPWLAEKWEISPDQLTYTFWLKKGVKFHDGTPFNAEAMKFSFDRMVNPDTKSRSARAAMGPYKSSEVVDEYTLKVNFSQPFGPFLDSVSSVILAPVSPAAVQKWGPDFGDHPVGTGPYVFKEWVKKDHVTITKNPDYNWAAPIFKHTGPGYVDSVTFKYITEDPVRSATLETGETNVINTVPPDDWTRFKNDPKFHVLSGVLTGHPYDWEINTKVAPTNELAVRQAILYATDKDAVINTLFKGAYIKAYGPLSQPTIAYDKSVEAMYQFNVAKARELLDQAGWKPGPDGIRVKDGNRLHVKWETIIDARPVEQLQAQMKEIGMEVEPYLAPLNLHIDIGQKGEGYNLIQLRYVAGDPDTLRVIYHSKNIGIGFNWSLYSDPALDKLLEDGAASTDINKRKELYAQAQKIVMDQALTLPLMLSHQLMVTRGEVYGVRLDTRGNTPWMYDAYIAK